MTMKIRLITCLPVLLLSLSAEATNYTVIQTGGGNFTTIQACATAMSAGDTCTVYAGTYNENVTVTAGTAGNFKTIQVNGNDLVYVLSFFVDSYNKIIGGTTPTPTSTGLHIQNPTSPNSFPCVQINVSATQVYIQNTNLYACGVLGVINVINTAPYASYVYIQNNTFAYGCSTSSAPNVCPAVLAFGDHWLVEGNDVSHILLGVNRLGSYGVIRNNTFHDNYGRDPNGIGFPEYDCIPSLVGTTGTISGTTVTWTGGYKFDNEFPGAWISISGTQYIIAGWSSSDDEHLTLQSSPQPPQGAVNISGGIGGNCHFDMVFAEPGQPTQYNLFENNMIINNIGHDNKVSLWQGDICTGNCYNAIVRYNAAIHNGAGVVEDDYSAVSPALGFYNVKSYNNSWVDVNAYPGNNLYGIASAFIANSINGADINNLYYFPEQVLSFNPYTCDINQPGGTCNSFVDQNDLAWCTGTTCNLLGRSYGQGNFTDDPGNIKADPLLVNYATNDVHLSPGSPAIGAGSSLTTVAAGDSGSGTALLVNDAGFFQDGYGLPGVNADQIRVGTSTVAQITSINYATNTLTLSSSITRSPGAPVYLFGDSNGRIVLTGNAPDIGAFPAGSGKPAPPTGLTASVN